MWDHRHISNLTNQRNITRDARDFALSQGLVIRAHHGDNYANHIPFTLLPSPIPKYLYQLCLDLHPIMNELMFKISTELDFMDRSLRDIIEVDDFTAKLFGIAKSVEKEGLSQPITSCINRSDYLLDHYTNEQFQNSLRIRQVEINAIASSMSPHSCKVQKMHKYLGTKYFGFEANDHSPSNDSLNFVAREIIKLYDLYSKSGSLVLVVTEHKTINFAEHILIELTVNELRPDVKFIRRRFSDIATSAKLGPNKELLLDENIEIAVIYYRFGYDPSNYDFDQSWETRLLMERSRAIKCPSISYHISGIKKFQQILCNQSELERFLSPSKAKQLTKVLCKFWPIDRESDAGRQGFELGLQSPSTLVLKPQREGGGHNLYGSSIKSHLECIVNSNDRKQYILMEKIKAPSELNWLLHASDDPDLDDGRLSTPENLVSELGIYGSIISDGSSILSNESAGYLVRSKRCGVDEGGVIAGYSGISSLILLDDEHGLERYYQF